MTSLTVGAALSQTGIYALQGQQALQGLRLWVDEANERDGVFIPELGRAVSLRLIAHDDHSRRSEVERLVARLITGEGVDFLIGPYSSGLTRAAAAIAEAHQKVMWNHGGSSDTIMRQGFRWTVHLPTPASGYFAGLFPCLLSSGAEGGYVAIIQRHHGTFSREVASGARHQAERHSFPVLPDFFYPDDPGQIFSLAEQLAATNPAVIIAVGRYDDDVNLARALARAGHVTKAIAAVAAPMQAFWRELPELADGDIGPSQWEPGAAVSPDVGPSSARFVERYRRSFSEVPDYPAAQAYAAGLILQQCVGLAGTCVDADLRAAADRLVCRTFYGDFQLDADTGAQVGHETVLVQWQDGEKKVIWPAPVAQAGLVYPKPQAWPRPKG